MEMPLEVYTFLTISSASAAQDLSTLTLLAMRPSQALCGGNMDAST
jgi:hypothetical protein